MEKISLPEEDIIEVEEDELEEPHLREQPTPEMVDKALSEMINNTIKNEWDALNMINSNIATLNYESPDKTDLIALLNEIADEKTIHIGMLNKALSLIDDTQQELMDAGEEKAEEIISEPATSDL